MNPETKSIVEKMEWQLSRLQSIEESLIEIRRELRANLNLLKFSKGREDEDKIKKEERDLRANRQNA